MKQSGTHSKEMRRRRNQRVAQHKQRKHACRERTDYLESCAAAKRVKYEREWPWRRPVAVQEASPEPKKKNVFERTVSPQAHVVLWRPSLAARLVSAVFSSGSAFANRFSTRN